MRCATTSWLDRFSVPLSLKHDQPLDGQSTVPGSEMVAGNFDWSSSMSVGQWFKHPRYPRFAELRLHRPVLPLAPTSRMYIRRAQFHYDERTGRLVRKSSTPFSVREPTNLPTGLP